ncbi:MAG: collagen-like protein [Bacteroidota bacterium]|uniref:Collagen-like protein n=1 Tax=Flagellimonas profundi TaxID=2915620 RepID=A0ABS3FAQ8_9FLAO|nr:collagen-like protein [Allomuricauda profundi]MBO0340057.1 collagen-like protein [Allomuricauda profundi]MEC7772750.1 collagen-like protein [Bacteroidota bacterium]
MNKFSTILGAVIVFVFAACEGPQGPPGFDGLDGLDGLDGADGIQGQVVEVEGVNFGYDAEANLFSTLITFSDVTDFEVFESDAVLVYRHDGIIDLNDGTTADAWTQIPQNYFLNEGTIQYVFAHTFVDVELFIDGNFDLSTLSTDFTDNQLFRIVFVPSEYAESPDFDASNIESVMSHLNIDEEHITTLDIN